jgi:hypothetical protein
VRLIRQSNCSKRKEKAANGLRFSCKNQRQSTDLIAKKLPSKCSSLRLTGNRQAGRRPFHFRLPLPVISATAPGVFGAGRVRCRTSRWRNTHFNFPVGVGDFAMVPGAFSAPPVPAKDSRRLTLSASRICLSIALSPSVFLIGSSNYFTAGAKRPASSFHESMILALVLRAL